MHLPPARLFAAGQLRYTKMLSDLLSVEIDVVEYENFNLRQHEPF